MNFLDYFLDRLTMVLVFGQVLEGIFVKRILLAEETYRCSPGIFVYRHVFFSFLLFFFLLSMIV